MAATANLGIGGYYDDNCYVVRRRVLTPFQSPFCERGDPRHQEKWVGESRRRAGKERREGMDVLTPYRSITPGIQ
jgi:hypothetical protein